MLPKITTRERTPDERRADEEDQRLLNEVREMSLREASGAPTLTPGPRRRRESRSRSSGETGSDSRHRRTRENGHSSRRDDTGRRSQDQLNPESERRRGRHSESRQRQIEHQSSLRSLISSADMSERDIEREIEDFARQIQEEGLLEGLDLDNIDLSRDDELSRRITEAYRRRQRGRSRQERTRRSNTSGHSGSYRPVDASQSESRAAAAGSGSRSSSRPHVHPRSASATRYGEDRSRPPPSMSANLDVREHTGRARRRTGSGGRSTTTPVSSSSPLSEARPAARSQTDLTLRTQTSDPTALRPSISEGRSSSTPNVPAPNPPPLELPANNTSNLQSFASRVPHGNPALRDTSSSQQPAAPPDQTSSDVAKAHHPAELSMVYSTLTSPGSDTPGTTPGHRRTRSQLYDEPSIRCSRCRREHIEYELHYNCEKCSDGQWNICLDCYRGRLGCPWWFGFGSAAWKNWEAEKERKGPLPMPHMLTACRYTPPPSTPGGADGRKTLTTDNPNNRLGSGTFCARCFVWTNECYWRCEDCNQGDWGFCNNCVNQGKSCTHMLLPLAHEATKANNDQPVGPRSPGRPPTATFITDPTVSSIGPFKPLTFTAVCGVCQDPIPPTKPRYHCFSCTNALIADAVAGDYDICLTCYHNLVAHGEISFENGHSGWRRCLSGHRMAIVGFTENKAGQWRYVDRDLVGGQALKREPYDSPKYRGQGLQKWSWSQGGQKCERLVTKDVKAVAPASDESVTFSQTFPPDGGVGHRGVAMWSWYPRAGVYDELLFPKGAEITEVECDNEEWFYGTYMGAKGLFPAPYVRIDPAHQST